MKLDLFNKTAITEEIKLKNKQYFELLKKEVITSVENSNNMNEEDLENLRNDK